MTLTRALLQSLAYLCRLMGQKKLIRFEELKTFPNVLQYPGDMAGNWHLFWKNNNPVILELACGKGEYAVGLGKLYPGKNFIGIDLKGNRIWVGAKKALQQNLNNVAFLRTQIDHVSSYFSVHEVKEIWITFPDPQLRRSKAKKRLTHPKFLRLYQQFLVPGGLVHLKTDSPDLYAFTKLVIELYNCRLHTDYEDIYSEAGINADLQIKTHYELLDIAGSNRIHYLCFSLPNELPGKEKDEELKQLLKDEPVD
ncbi:MAG: tRNA (guanosine(46)-N7)-methyltransferase TrmB [Chitinophagaceae bacterium]